MGREVDYCAESSRDKHARLFFAREEIEDTYCSRVSWNVARVDITRTSAGRNVF